MKRILWSVDNAIAENIIDPYGNLRAPLLKVPAAHCISHDETLDGPNNIVDATQNAWQILDPHTGRPLKRTEINLKKADARFPKSLRVISLALLRDLGLFNYSFMPSCLYYDQILFHGNYLPELLLMRELFIKQFKRGLKCKEIIFLGGQRALGQAPFELISLCNRRLKRLRDLHDRSAPNSPGWYAPDSYTFSYIWRNLPMPEDMEGMEDIKLRLIAAPDPIGIDGKPIPVDTLGTLRCFLQSKHFQPGRSYLVLSCAPFTLRQHLITRSFLRKEDPHAHMETIGAHCSATRLSKRRKALSVTVCLRELTNLLWELRRWQALRRELSI